MKKFKCVLCGYISNNAFCQECLDQARDYFDIISEFIKSNPKPTIIDVYNATGVPLRVINGLLDMGWIELVKEEVIVQQK